MPYKDPARQLAAKHQHYLDNKDAYMARGAIRRRDKKAWFKAKVLHGKRCILCHEDDEACLDFHHMNPDTKDDSVSVLLSHLRSKERILREVEKCVVLCSNCHRKFHRDFA